MNQIVVSEEQCPVHAGELGASPHRHKQGLQYDVRGLAALHRLDDDTTGVEIDDDREIGEALTGKAPSSSPDYFVLLDGLLLSSWHSRLEPDP